MSRIVVKLGGAQLAAGPALKRTVAAVKQACDAGHQVVIVHGGGAQIRSLCQRLGLVENKVEGLRVTDAATAEAALAVLAGTEGKKLAAALCAAGIDSLSLCGCDGNLMLVEPAQDGQLGYVGDIVEVNPRVLLDQLANSRVPLVAPLAPVRPGLGAPSDHLYNINADAAAGPIAAALHADALLLMTDVTGVLDAAGKPLSELDADAAEALLQSGAAQGGMIPKLRAAVAAAQQMPGGTVRIAGLQSQEAILTALGGTTGTRVLPPAAPSTSAPKTTQEASSHG